MKKKILSLAIVLCLTVALAVPAMAAGTITNPNNDGSNVIPNVNGSTDDVNAPYNGPYDGSGTVQNDGGDIESYGFSTQTYYASKDEWLTDSDDNGSDSDINDGTDIYVWAKVSDDGAALYKIDIAWGAMKFEFSGGGKTWNVNEHIYEDGASAQKAWLLDDGDNDGTTGNAGGGTDYVYLGGTNNKIDITNHSNCGITATFAYTMDETNGNSMFNDLGSSDKVVGNFFADNASAIAAALLLTDSSIGTDLNALLLKNDIYDQTPGGGGKTSTPNAIALDTAEHKTDKMNEAGAAVTKSIYFAFSGTPDEGRGSVLDTFKKVGVITVTVEPNIDPALNAS